MKKFSKDDLSSAGLSGALPDTSAHKEVVPEIEIDEVPFQIPKEMSPPGEELARLLAERIAGAESQALKLEVELGRLREESESSRRSTLLALVETLDDMEAVLAAFQPVSGRKPAAGARKTSSRRKAKVQDAEPVSQEGYARLLHVAKRLEEVLRQAGVEPVAIKAGAPVDPERDYVLQTVRSRRLADGAVAEVVKKAYLDKLTGRFLRKAVVKAVRNR